jgi:hypothetical protein
MTLKGPIEATIESGVDHFPVELDPGGYKVTLESPSLNGIQLEFTLLQEPDAPSKLTLQWPEVQAAPMPPLTSTEPKTHADSPSMSAPSSLPASPSGSSAAVPATAAQASPVPPASDAKPALADIKPGTTQEASPPNKWWPSIATGAATAALITYAIVERIAAGDAQDRYNQNCSASTSGNCDAYREDLQSSARARGRADVSGVLGCIAGGAFLYFTASASF